MAAGLLSTLGLSSPPKARAGGGKASGDAAAAKAQYDKDWQDIVAFAKRIEDVPTRGELIGKLQECDRQKKAAERAGADPIAQAKLFEAARAGIAKAREEADRKSTDLARGEAQKLRAPVTAGYKAAYDAHSALEKEQKALDARVKAADGTARKDLQAKKAELDAKVKEADHLRAQAEADLKALDDPGAGREIFAAILARQKSAASVSKHTEVDEHPDEAKGIGGKHVTTKKTAFAKGEATSEKTDERRSFGLDGMTKTKTTDKETVTAERTMRTSDSETVNVSKDGWSKEKTQKAELEHRDGSKLSVENKNKTEIGKDGAKQTTSRSVEYADETKKDTSKTAAFERGEGQAALSLAGSGQKVDGDGRGASADGKVKGGMIAGKDGLGAMTGGEGNAKLRGKEGLSAGPVVGLDSSIVCNIGEPVGDPKQPEKLRYPLKLEVNLGVSVGVTGGREKEGAAIKGEVSVKAGKAVWMRRTYLLPRDEAAAYVAALGRANGGVVAATQKEFAIIAAGMSKGWPFAQQMFLGESGITDVGKGESASRGGSSSVKGKAAVSAKAVSVELAGEESDQNATAASRDDDDNLTVDRSGGHTSKKSGKVGIQSGLVGGSFGGASSVQTSYGKTIKLTAQNDPKGELRAELAKCRSDADIDAFAQKHPEAVDSTRSARAQDDSSSVGMSVGKLDAEIGLHHGVDEEEERDGKGKLKSRKVTGKAGAGGSFGIGKTRVGDKVEDEAASEIDGEGNASTDLKRSKTGTDAAKWAKAHVPFMGDKKSGGALTKLAGGEEEPDTDRKEQSGLKLGNSDLDALGKLACGDWRKWQKAEVHGSPRYIGDWEKAGKEIRAAGGERGAVAEALSRFIGGDNGRLDMITYFLRPDGKVSTGTRYEFPDSLQPQKKDYDALVITDVAKAFAALVEQQGAEKAAAEGKDMAARLDKLYDAIVAAQDFAQASVRAEMLKTVNRRRTELDAAIRKNAGVVDEKAAQEAEYHRILKACVQYEVTQGELFTQINGWYAPGRFYNNDKIVRALQQLRNLYGNWTPDWNRAAEIGKAIGKPEATWSHFRPNLAEFQKIEQKVRF